MSKKTVSMSEIIFFYLKNGLMGNLRIESTAYLDCNTSETFIPSRYKYLSCSSISPVIQEVHSCEESSVECIMHLSTDEVLWINQLGYTMIEYQFIKIFITFHTNVAYRYAYTSRILYFTNIAKFLDLLMQEAVSKSSKKWWGMNLQHEIWYLTGKINLTATEILDIKNHLYFKFRVTFTENNNFRT